MNRTSVSKRITEIFLKIFGPKTKVEASVTVEEMKGWDSLIHVKLIDAIEKEFQISFSVSEIMSLETVGSMISLVQEKLKRAA